VAPELHPYLSNSRVREDTKMTKLAATNLRALGNRGQALAETAIGLTIIIFLVMGIVEFGRAFLIANAVTNAARVGARAVAMDTNRDEQGYLTSSNHIVTAVRNELSSTVGASLANSLTIVVGQPTTSIALAQVTVSGQVPYMFNLVGTSFQLQRTVSYRDQSR